MWILPPLNTTEPSREVITTIQTLANATPFSIIYLVKASFRG
jgi:hypothetical protein